MALQLSHVGRSLYIKYIITIEPYDVHTCSRIQLQCIKYGCSLNRGSLTGAFLVFDCKLTYSCAFFHCELICSTAKNMVNTCKTLSDIRQSATSNLCMSAYHLVL